VGIVKLLLAAGADPNAKGNHRCGRPLHYAADGYVLVPAWNPPEQVKTVRALIAAGAEINAQDKNGATALHRAVRTRSAAAVGALLEAGADIEAKNNSGSTPLHLAVQNTGRGGSGAAAAIENQRQIIKELLSFGANTNAKTTNGKSVRDCTRSAWIREFL